MIYSHGVADYMSLFLDVLVATICVLLEVSFMLCFFGYNLILEFSFVN